MILLLGLNGYIGSQFVKEMRDRSIPFVTMERPRYTVFGDVYRWVKANSGSIELVINCAAFIPKESVSLCDKSPAATIKGNTLLPAMLAHACEALSIPLAQISTGCLWSDGKEHLDDDVPQRDFNGYCGFYVGTKVLAEDEVRKYPSHYIWRIRLPFDEFDTSRNYLTKLTQFKDVFDHCNSISHRSDFVKACLDLWKLRAPFGTYNVTNPGAITARRIIEEMTARGIIKEMPTFTSGHQGDCQLNVQKLLSVGVLMRPVEEAVKESLDRWKKAE